MEMIKVGPVGGHGGSIWDEKGRDEVAGIFVSYSKNTIQSLQFLFYENGNLVQSNKHGSDHCENFCAVLFDYPSEFLTLLSGSYGNNGHTTVLEAIKFNTNKDTYGPFGRTQPEKEFNTNEDTYEPFGCTQPEKDSKHFNFQLGNHRLFGGFHGKKSRNAVLSIGIYVKPDISSMISLNDLRVKDEKEDD